MHLVVDDQSPVALVEQGEVRELLLEWAGDEPDLPMDTALDNADPRAVFDLETDQRPEGSFWETVTATVFVSPKTKPAAKTDELDETEETTGWGLSPIMIAALAVIVIGGLAALLGGVVLLLVLLLR